MSVRVLSSNEAQNRLSDILDASHENQDTIIERANQPVAAVIPYVDYIALFDTLNRLRQNRVATVDTTLQQAESSRTTTGQARDSLLTLAGQFASGITDTADRAEEILEAEVNSISGLSVQ